MLLILPRSLERFSFVHTDQFFSSHFLKVKPETVRFPPIRISHLLIRHFILHTLVSEFILQMEGEGSFGDGEWKIGISEKEGQLKANSIPFSPFLHYLRFPYSTIHRADLDIDISIVPNSQPFYENMVDLNCNILLRDLQMKEEEGVETSELSSLGIAVAEYMKAHAARIPLKFSLELEEPDELTLEKIAPAFHLAMLENLNTEEGKELISKVGI